MSEHDIRLKYDTDDDGIWLCCDPCDWECHLGYWPLLSDASDAAQGHQYASGR